MPFLAALLVATPIWGFALRPPTAIPTSLPILELTAQLRAAEVDDEVARERAAEAHNLEMMDWTRGFSVASVVAFAAAGVLGFIQLADEYGFHSDPSQTACATGNAVLDYCGEPTPWAHLIAVGATAGLGLTTFAFTTQVDFERAARRDGDWRIYEVTRWVGLAMFIVQGLGGFLIANSIRFGWADEQRDFETLQALAIAHMAWGTATMGLEVYNTAIMF